MIDHWNKHEEIFNLWIRKNERLHVGMDILQPFIEPFKAANPNTNLNHCQDCLVTMLIWARAEVRKLKQA